MNVQEFQARKVLRIARTLAHFVATTPAEKLDWCPCLDEKSCTRSVLDQIGECIACNRSIANLLGGGNISFDSGRSFTDGQTAQEELLRSAEELAAILRIMPDEALTHPYTMPSITVTGEVLIDIPTRNMSYHGGQINFLQRLLGDPESHIPPCAFK
ncbi:MAG: DinB superfamily [Chthonomonadaceae bacterium]|nr:DinB superfamily [Chthonomonadaceae bacterium]